MQVEVEIKSTQIIKNKEQTMTQKGIGTLKSYEKGTILSCEILKNNMNFEMTVLKDKVLLKKEDQNMTFELGKTTKSTLETPYGNIDMNITTNSINILKQDDKISKIEINYYIELRERIKYENRIAITIK